MHLSTLPPPPPPPPPPVGWVGLGGDLTFLVNQMPHPGDELQCQMPLSQGGDGWGVGGDLTFTPHIIYFYVEKSNPPGVGHSFSVKCPINPRAPIPGGGGGGGGGCVVVGHAIDRCITHTFLGRASTLCKN